MIATLLQIVAAGAVTGCVYALAAIALLVVFKSTEVVNFGGGDLLMFGAYIGLLCIDYFNLSYGPSALVTATAMFAIGVAFEWFVLNTLRRRHGPSRILASLVIATLGLSYVLRGSVRLFNYTEDVRRLPPIWHGPPLSIGPIILQSQDLAIVGASALFVALLFAFFEYSWLGKALRAASVNPRAAELVGIRVSRMRLLSWGIACLVSGWAGLLIGGKIPMTPDFGSQLLFLTFAAATIGGFQSLPGCIVGGVLLGVVQNLVGFFLSSSAIAVAPFVIIMIVLVCKPQGLFGARSALKKV